ncbi:MAG: metallophosphoesterase [Acidobacteriota bacterium]|nr:MAG: metallophosphoesterase [Acidobacteriota bacterium]
MKIFAIGDLHLSFARPKPMEIFGELWRDHPIKLAAAWDRLVGPQDLVLVAGDTSWAHSLAQAAPDLAFLAERPGRLKLILRGNHDSWWASAEKVRRALPEGLAILQNDALRWADGSKGQRGLEGVVVCGARGWNLPGMPWTDPDRDLPIYRRELGRLELSLAAARRLASPGDTLLAMLHFPPLGPGQMQSEVLERLSAAGVDLAVYGHLHGEDHRWAPEGTFDGVQVRFVAADFVDFTPQLVFERGRGIVPAPSAPADGPR